MKHPSDTVRTLRSPVGLVLYLLAPLQANWLTLEEDIDSKGLIPPEGFDAVICMGSSFPHLPDKYVFFLFAIISRSNYEVSNKHLYITVRRRKYNKSTDGRKKKK